MESIHTDLQASNLAKKKTMTAKILVHVFLSLLLSLGDQQSKWMVGVGAVQIPAKFDGFVHGNPEKFNPKSVLIEAFFDPLCPFSRDSWPPLKKVLHLYGSKVSLVVHPFPLPYHDNAYAASRALHIVNEVNRAATYQLWESFFKHQAKFYSKETSNNTRTEVVDLIAKFAAHSLGHAFYSVVKSGLNDTETDLKTRVSFKYACSRGVIGTPTFFVNGFQLPDDDSTSNYKGWRKIIDPLVHTSGDGFH